MFTFSPLFFLPWLLENMFQVPEEMLPEAISLIQWAIPSILVRIVADNLKTFLLNLGFLKRTGMVMGFNIIPFAAVSYLFLVVFDFGAMGVGMSLMFYEVTSVITLYFRLFRPKVDDDYKDSSLSIGQGMPQFLRKTIRMIFTEFPMAVMWSCMQFILGITEDIVDLAAYSLLFILISIIKRLMVNSSQNFPKILIFSLDRI